MKVRRLGGWLYIGKLGIALRRPLAFTWDIREGVFCGLYFHPLRWVKNDYYADTSRQG